MHQNWRWCCPKYLLGFEIAKGVWEVARLITTWLSRNLHTGRDVVIRNAHRVWSSVAQTLGLRPESCSKKRWMFGFFIFCCSIYVETSLWADPPSKVLHKMCKNFEIFETLLKLNGQEDVISKRWRKFVHLLFVYYAEIVWAEGLK